MEAPIFINCHNGRVPIYPPSDTQDRDGVQFVGKLRQGEPRALRSPDYRTKAFQIFPAVKPFQEITPSLAVQYDIVLSRIGVKRRHPSAFKVREKDRQPIGYITYPGISSQVDFTRIRNARTPEERYEWIKLYGDIVLEKPVYEDDSALHLIEVETLNNNGFRAFLCPLEDHPLHVRICDAEIISLIQRRERIHDSMFQTAAERLKDLWTSYY